MSVRDGLLALLHRGPRHGYQLKSEFEAATGRVWPLNVGQVYTTLDRLQRDGLVDASERDGDGNQKEYALTADGREELARWFDGGAADAPPPRDELLLKILVAIEVDPDRAIDVITTQRTALFERLQGFRRSTRANGDRAAALVAEALIARAEADLRWLDTCEARLRAEGAT